MVVIYKLADDERETALREANEYVNADPLRVYRLGGHQLRCLAALVLESKAHAEFIESAFSAHPNLDIDVARVRGDTEY